MTEKYSLGIDVGLKNLAFCVMSNGVGDGQYKIHLWKNYNLLEKECCVCGCKASLTGVNRSVCKRHNKQFPDEKFKAVPLVTKMSLQSITKIVLDFLDSILDDPVFDNINVANIENQPRVNNKMRMVSVLIFGRLVDRLSDSCVVKFVNANKKLFGQNKGKEFKGAKGYANRKELSVEIIKKKLADSTVDSVKWLELFTSCKKQHDLADSMGFAILGLS